MKERAYKLMKLWCDTLLSYQVKTHTPYTNNALLCPACHVIHGRIADLCFPLSVLWQKTGDEKYLKAADDLIDWSEYNLKTECGLWHNDVGNLWTGVSAFSAMSIGEALFHFQDILPEKLKNKWYTIFIRLVDAVMQYDKDKNLQPATNYFCGFAAALAMAWKLTGEQKYYDKSKYWLGGALARFDANGLLYGEQNGEPLLADDGSRCIDMGYNLEESIPSLLRYATLTGEHMEFFRDRLRDHLAFLLPDGAIDNSFGSRHNKWTYWGSRTSDGLTGGLALVLDDPMFREACERVLSLYEKCTHDGLLAMPMAYDANEPTCLHHTFPHAKALAALVLAEDNTNASEKVLLPCEKEYGIKKYQNGRLVLASNGAFRATISAVNALFLSEDTSNGGGSFNLLYNKAYGVICAATSAEYIPSEPLNQQYLRNSDTTECMTAQFIVDGAQACKDKTVILTTNETSVTAKAKLWEATYTIHEDYVEIALTSEKGVYHLPIVCAPQCDVVKSKDGCTLTIDNKLILTASKPLLADCNKRAFNQVGGLMYLPIAVDVCGEAKISLKIV